MISQKHFDEEKMENSFDIELEEYEEFDLDDFDDEDLDGLKEQDEIFDLIGD